MLSYNFKTSYVKQKGKKEQKGRTDLFQISYMEAFFLITVYLKELGENGAMRNESETKRTNKFVSLMKQICTSFLFHSSFQRKK